MSNLPARCPYKVLGVSPNSTMAEIKARYRVLVLKFHPDVDDSPAAKKLFIEVQSAYETLETNSSRAAYDRAMNQEAKYAAQENADTRPRKPTAPMNDDWWMQSDTIQEYAKQQFEAQKLQKRRQFEAKSSTFRWPTGESFDKMDDHQKYFYYQMMRPRRSFSTLAASSRYIFRRL